MFIKEFVQLRRDRVTFATMIFIPVVQLLLFGYAINTTPRHLPTAVLVHEESDLCPLDPRRAQQHRPTSGHAGRPHRSRDGPLDALGRRAVRRRDPGRLRAQRAARRPPGAAGGRRRQRSGRRRHRARRAGGHRATALARDRGLPEPAAGCRAFEIRQHRRYNPAAVTSLNIVPGLLGTILTMTMLIFTALSVTREVERGTMESLLAMPIKPLEIMLGKIAPYIFIGFIQAALILVFASLCSRCRSTAASLLLAVLSSTLFIATNLSIGYTFSTIAQNQLQAIQMSFMFFLPNILLSGFMFPFAGMPRWAQWIGEVLPLTHYIRIVRGIMLKGATLYDLQFEALALVGLMLLAMTLAVRRFRRTLD